MKGAVVAALCGVCFLAAALGVSSQDRAGQVKDLIRRMLASNEAYMKAHGEGHFKAFVQAQHPRATVVACSDSRVQMQAIDSEPDGDLFVIRNIGNQVATCEGSVEYGVRRLHTPVLLILGHVRCGAVQAAMGDYSKEPIAIRRELDTLELKKGGAWLEEVEANVHSQVKAALAEFAPEVKDGSLTVVGAVYDFADDLEEGHGRLVVIDVNGETDPARLQAWIGGPKK